MRNIVPMSGIKILALRLFLLLTVLVGTQCGAEFSYSPSRGEPRDGGALSFVDVANQVGLDTRHSAFIEEASADPIAMMGGGLCWIDVDRDGWLDLFVTDTWANEEWSLWQDKGGLPTSKIFRNEKGTFIDHSQRWSAEIEARANGCVVADFNGDNRADLYVTTDRENVLLINTSEGFEDQSEDAAVDAYGWHTGATAGDVNNDGLVDLVVAGYADTNTPRPSAQTGFPNTFEPVPDIVYINEGNENDQVTFSPLDNSGLEPDGSEYGLGVSLIDVDNDNDLDLYVANDTQPNRLYLNQHENESGDTIFADVSEASGLDDPNSGMGVAIADLNNDELPDIMVTNLAGQGHMVATSDQQASYSLASGAASELGDQYTGWGTTFADFDLDGDQDLIVASGSIPILDTTEAGEPVNYLSNAGDDSTPRYSNASDSVGISELEDRNGRSVAAADYDNDGDMDVAISAIGQPLMLLENRSSHGSWLGVDLGVPKAGTKATLTFEDGTVIRRYVVAGSSWLSSEDQRMHFGFRSSTPARLDVDLPDGETVSIENPEPNQILHIP